MSGSLKINALAGNCIGLDLTMERMLGYNAAMQMLLDPSRFDVLLCENTFGDLLSDEATVRAGSLGMLSSADFGTVSKVGRPFGIYEPAGGPSPDIAGSGIVNSSAQILSVALLLRHSLGLAEAATVGERAGSTSFAAGHRPGDIRTAAVSFAISTREMGQPIIAHPLHL